MLGITSSLTTKLIGCVANFVCEHYAKLDSLIDSSSNLVTKLILPDTKHFDFSDTPQFSPFSKTMGISGKMPAEAIKDTLNLRMLDFFNKHLYLN